MTKLKAIFTSGWFYGTAWTLWALLTVYVWFGWTPFIIAGAIVAVIAVICLLAWVNEKTGGALGFWLIFSALSDN